MRQAVLVLGAESTGTKLMTEILVKQGYFGDVGNEQRLDALLHDDRWFAIKVPSDANLVLRRSFPHGLYMPDVVQVMWAFHCRGYQARAIVTMRDWFCAQCSQLHDHTHALTPAHSHTKLRTAYVAIWEGLRVSGADYVVANYEALLMRPVAFSRRLFRWLGAPFDEHKLPEVHDENAKWCD